MNAHTDGDAIVHFKHANVIHAGDTYFSGMYPFIDMAHGGSNDGYIKAFDEKYGGGFINNETFVKMLYQNMTPDPS